MDRATVYTQEQGRSVDFLFAQRATMIAIAKLAQAAFGSNTIVRGLAVTPNSPAALNVLVGVGEIYTMAQVDATTWGSLGADSDVILKQGLNMTAQTIATPAPSTSGFSINYLIEAQYQDQDTTAVVLPFFNSANPQQPLNGQGGNGAPLPTERQGVCAIQAKAGVAATTGTQVTPTVDAGWTAIAVVTVANGQSTVTSGNISVPAGVPQITSLLQMVQVGSSQYAVDSSTTANQIALALTPPITSYTDGQAIVFKAANNNTGPCTINAGGGSVPLVGAAGALQGGEIVAGKQYTARYSASVTEFILSGQTGGAQQIAPATASNQAVNAAQTALANYQLKTVGGNPNLFLMPYGGSYAFIPGIGVVQIPAAGVQLAPSGLTANTTYYIYLTVVSGTPTLIPTTTGHVTDATGVEVMSGDNTRLLVGMERAFSATAWAGLCRSWRNDPGFAAVTPLTSSASTTSSSYVELSTALRTNFLLWTGEIPVASADGQVANTAGTAAGSNTSIGFDGVSPAETSNGTTSVVANANMSMAVSIPQKGLAEGFHYATLLGTVGGGTATWFGAANAGFRCSIKVCIAPRK